MKYYIYLPFKSEYRQEIDYIPLSFLLYFSWSKYKFKYCQCEEYYPYTRHEGNHYFSIALGIFYWSIQLTFYKPEKYKDYNDFDGEFTEEDFNKIKSNYPKKDKK